MGFLTSRLSLIRTCAIERLRYGLPEASGPMDREAVFVLDGVGGFQFVPLMVRRVLREQAGDIGTVVYRWQFGVPGEIWTDLMWHSRNRRKAVELAEKLASFREAHPDARVHLLAYSGGSGLALWACERLGPTVDLESLILVCPAVAPEFNLGPALRNVGRCYTLVSSRDRWILGVGTRVFGTVDRRFSSAAGRLGFHRPPLLSLEDQNAYDRLWQIQWSEDLRSLGHVGGHAGWAGLLFLREHLLPLLRGRPRLRATKLEDGAATDPPGPASLTAGRVRADA